MMDVMPTNRTRPVRTTTVRRTAAARLVAAVTLGAVLAACGGGSEQEIDVASTDAAGPASGATVAAPDATEILTLARGERAAPPAALETVDLVVGDGAEAVAGTRVVVQYLGVRWSDGGVFDASWSRGRPFEFDLGAGQVIAGWEQGVTGMRVGGRRLLVIPPALAYGDRGAGSVIGPGETLVFAVDLVGVG